MGRTKEEWIRQQELEPMYEWIEENYGDDAISNVRWNNAERMLLRIDKAFQSINKLNQSNDIYISLKNIFN